MTPCALIQKYRRYDGTIVSHPNLPHLERAALSTAHSWEPSQKDAHKDSEGAQAVTTKDGVLGRELLAGAALLLLGGSRSKAEVIFGRLPWTPNAGSLPEPARPGPWLFFTGDEGRKLEALADHIIPPDAETPGDKYQRSSLPFVFRKGRTTTLSKRNFAEERYDGEIVQLERWAARPVPGTGWKS